MSSELRAAPQTFSLAPGVDANPTSQPQAVTPGKAVRELHALVDVDSTSRVQSSDVNVQQAKIAVVDDEPTNIKVLCRLLNLSSPVLEMATRIALTHHEWWDGSGYPLGLKGEDIPLEGRITAVADVFDALSTKRCYKGAFPLSKCFEIMVEERETHFDPDVLDAFVSARSEIIEAQLRYAEEI